MSEEKKSTEKETNALDLSGLNFGPAWARSDSESGTVKKYKDRDERGGEGRPGGRNRQGGRQDDRRGGGDRRQGGGGGGRSFGGGGGRDQGRGNDRGNERRGGAFQERPRREEVPAPDGVQAKVMPVEESLDKLAKEITGSGRTYSVFDLAKFLLQARDRFQVNFLREGGKFFRCTKDNSLWLSKDEALRHLWRADWLGELYHEVQTEVEVPKGSFQAVAKCGISGEYLGPPNYHAYQTNVTQLHRERFSHMSLEAYKSKVRMEHGEEAVNAWLDSMKTVTRWTPRSAEEIAKAAAEATQVGKNAANKVTEVKEAEDEKPLLEETSLEKVAGETPVEPAATPDPAEATNPTDLVAEAEAEAETEALIDEESPVATTEEIPESADEPAAKTEELLDEKEVEAHFVKNNFSDIFVETDRAWVTGDIKGFLLSPGLLTLLKNTVADEKRYPGKLTPLLCRQLSGRHVAVYKWRKKLKAGPSRPHAVPEEMKLSDRPQQILDWLAEHSGKKLAVLWETVLPKDADETVKREWFHDLHWLLNQGHAIFLSDMTLHLAKKPEKEQQTAAKKGAKNKVGEKAADNKAEAKKNVAKTPETSPAQPESAEGQLPEPVEPAVEVTPPEKAPDVEVPSEPTTGEIADETPVAENAESEPATDEKSDGAN